MAKVRLDHNVQQRASLRGGWFGFLSGESMGKSVERAIIDLNRRGYRVAFMIPDQWSLVRRILNILLTIVTLGFVSHSPGILIIGELGDPEQPMPPAS